MAKVSQRQIVADISPVQGGNAPMPGENPDGSSYFAQVTGGEISAAVEKVYDGGSKFPEVLCAVAEVVDVTVTRHYATDRDKTFLNNLRSLVGSAYYDITFYELDCDLKAPDTMRQYTGALCVGLTEPDGDSASGAPASYSLTFSMGPITSLPA